MAANSVETGAGFVGKLSVKRAFSLVCMTPVATRHAGQYGAGVFLSGHYKLPWQTGNVCEGRLYLFRRGLVDGWLRKSCFVVFATSVHLVQARGELPRGIALNQNVLRGRAVHRDQLTLQKNDLPPLSPLLLIEEALIL